MSSQIERAERIMERAWRLYSAAEKGGHVQDMERFYQAYSLAWAHWGKLMADQPPQPAREWQPGEEIPF